VAYSCRDRTAPTCAWVNGALPSTNCWQWRPLPPWRHFDYELAAMLVRIATEEPEAADDTGPGQPSRCRRRRPGRCG
jgi:hypothetical protein